MATGLGGTETSVYIYVCVCETLGKENKDPQIKIVVLDEFNIDKMSTLLKLTYQSNVILIYVSMAFSQN